MTLEEQYGSRPDLLPRSMVRVALVGGRPGWVARAETELLGLREHLEYERRSLGRFPRASDGSVAWSTVPAGAILAASPDPTAVETILRQRVTSASLVFFWDSLALPSVRIGFDAAVGQFPSIRESIAAFWIYAVDDRRLVEHTFAGVTTAASIPRGSRDG